MNKILVIMVLSGFIFLSGCIEDVKTDDGQELPITSINEYPVYNVTQDGANFWVLYNDNGSLKQAFVRPATNPPIFNINDEVIVSNENKIVVYYHAGIPLLVNGYQNYSLYWVDTGGAS